MGRADTNGKRPARENCGNCGHRVVVASAHNLTGESLCMALPPQMFVMPMQGPKGVMMVPASAQPRVEMDGWCGRWAPQDAPPIAAN